MGGDLEDGVGAGVGDPGTFLNLAGPQFINDGDSAGGLVADDGSASAALEFGDEFRGEGGGAGGEEMETGLHEEASHFPVSGRGVLALGSFLHGAEGGGRVWMGGDARDEDSVGEKGGDVAEAEGLEGGEGEGREGGGGGDMGYEI